MIFNVLLVFKIVINAYYVKVTELVNRIVYVKIIIMMMEYKKIVKVKNIIYIIVTIINILIFNI